MVKAIRLDLPEILVLMFDRKIDNRGTSVRLFNEKQFNEIGIGTKFIEEILYSPKKAGTLYGIHFQNKPKPQTKMIRCIKGKGLDYAVDLRKDSSTYKKWVCTDLSAKNGKIIYIPPGFGHVFLSLEDNTDLLFWIDNLFDAELSKAIKYNDPELNIEYPIKSPILSEQDTYAKGLDEVEINL
jgi:dTDP-4-dehydrorhamnose 3,5-epimerase